MELIIVITVVAILAGGLFVASKPQKRIGETNDAKRKNDAQAIEQAIKVVATDSGVMPTELKGLTENQYFAIVKAGGNTDGTYTCTALGTSLVKKDISASLLSVLPQIPIDPELTSTSNETGYYIVRRGSSYDVEPCNTYRLAATSGNKQMCGDGYCGTTESCASCSSDCGVCPAVCPNGVREGAEICDDGDTDVERCGDSITQSGGAIYCNANCTEVITLNEQCDDGNSSNLDACLNTCVSATCGDTYCGNDETCSTCSADCGACTQQYSVDKYSNTVTDAGGSFAWTNPNNVKTDNGVQGYALGGPQTFYVDNMVSIIKSDGSVGAANYKDLSGWPLSWAVSTYGDSANKWGESWTPADIRDSDFGVAFNLFADEYEETSNTLKVTDFRFTEAEIPNGATIDGIIVYIEKRNRTTAKAPISSYGDVDVIHIKVYLTY